MRERAREPGMDLGPLVARVLAHVLAQDPPLRGALRLRSIPSRTAQKRPLRDAEGTMTRELRQCGQTTSREMQPTLSELQFSQLMAATVEEHGAAWSCFQTLVRLCMFAAERGLLIGDAQPAARSLRYTDTSMSDFMRQLSFYLTVLAVVIFPRLAAGQMGTAYYTMSVKINLDLETLMAQMPPGMLEEMDSTEIAAALAQLGNLGGQTIEMTAITRFRGDESTTTLESPGGGLLAEMPSQYMYANRATGEGLMYMPDLSDLGEAGSILVRTPINDPDWHFTDADSVVLGYAVKQATATSDTMSATVWYAPGIGSPAGPPQLGGGLPGLILQADASIVGMGTVTFAADSVLDTVDLPVVPPVGIPITLEEYTERVREAANALRDQY